MSRTVANKKRSLGAVIVPVEQQRIAIPVVNNHNKKNKRSSNRALSIAAEEAATTVVNCLTHTGCNFYEQNHVGSIGSDSDALAVTNNVSNLDEVPARLVVTSDVETDGLLRTAQDEREDDGNTGEAIPRKESSSLGLIFEIGNMHYDRNNRLQRERPLRISVVEAALRDVGLLSRCTIYETKEGILSEQDYYHSPHLPGYLKRCVQTWLMLHTRTAITFVVTWESLIYYIQA
jgi:hypothetical protein